MHTTTEYFSFIGEKKNHNAKNKGTTGNNILEKNPKNLYSLEEIKMYNFYLEMALLFS